MLQRDEQDVDVDLRRIKNRLRERDEEKEKKRREKNDSRKRRDSPPLSSHRSRNSSLSNRSNRDNDLSDHDARRKSNSRLSFADDLEFDGFVKTKNSKAESPLKKMLSSELNNMRSMESLRGTSKSKKSGSLNNSDSDSEKHKDKDRSDRHRSRDRDSQKKEERDSSRTRKKSMSSSQIFDFKYQAVSKLNESVQEPKNFKKWKTRTTKGSFYYNDKLEGIVSNSFALDLQSDANIFFSIEPYKTQLHSSKLYLALILIRKIYLNFKINLRF